VYYYTKSSLSVGVFEALRNAAARAGQFFSRKICVLSKTPTEKEVCYLI